MYEKSITLLEERGVTLNDIVDCVVYLQKDYVENINRDDILEIVHSVLQKREVQHALLTGIQIDKETEQGKFGDAELNDIINRDEGLYGIDE
ncbi:MAG: phosphatidylglycerophosphatase A, partial [Erysipelothrix sp.]|nr:phosphatidylglycerophosphatase A [Erysipelothrix sp.]